MNDLRAFIELSDRVMVCYQQRRFADALDAVDAARSKFPGYRSTLAYWSACLHCLAGDGAAATRELQGALDGGGWWADERLRADEDLASLQGNPVFEAIVIESARRRAQAGRGLVPRLLVRRPQGDVRGVLLTLHGGGWRSAEEFEQHWESALDTGVVVAVPQSSQPTSDEGFGWPDPALAEREIAEHLQGLTQQDPGQPLILAGFSQGASLALRWALSGRFNAVVGFVAVNPGVTDPEPFLDTVRDPARRGVLLVGESDPRRGGIEQLSLDLPRLGVDCSCDVMPGVGHWFADDFADRLTRALEFVLS